MFTGLFCVYFGQVQCAEIPTPDKQAAAPQAPRRGALFKVSRSGHTLYLFGTIHVGQDSFYPLEHVVTEALARASVIALEADLSKDKPALEGAMNKYGLYAQPDGLSNHVPPALYKRLLALSDKYKLPAGTIDRFKPGMAASFLAMFEYAAFGYEASRGVDAYIAAFAKARNKVVVDLETVEGQLSLFDQMSAPEQIDCLENVADDIEGRTGRKKMTEIVDLWRAADIAGLDAFAKEAADDDSICGKFSSRMLMAQRNPGLAAGIAKIIDTEKDGFAGIGTLHLIGVGSVPELLSRRGYRVERIY